VERKRPQQNRVDDGEHRCCPAYAKTQHEDNDDGKAGITTQRSDRVTDVRKKNRELLRSSTHCDIEDTQRYPVDTPQREKLQLEECAVLFQESGYRTGLTKVGVSGATVGLQPEDPTIAELKPLGYVTGQFGKNHLGDRNEYLRR
jgi:hypothetical protein